VLGGFGLFATKGDRAYWNDSQNWYFADTTGWTPLASGGATVAAVDDTTLYTAGSSLQSLPIAGGTPTTLNNAGYPFALGDNLIYGLEEIDDGIVINKLPKTGGAWVRILALGGGSPRKIVVVGDRYFVSVERRLFYSNREDSILTGLFTGNAPPVRIVQQVRSDRLPSMLFAATATTLYWSDGRAVYQRALSEVTAP
jgi:hypothetical protein